MDQGLRSPGQRLQKIAPDSAIQPIQVSPLIKQLLEGPDDLFGSGSEDKKKGHRQTREAALFRTIGMLTTELEWLKTISASQPF